MQPSNNAHTIASYLLVKLYPSRVNVLPHSGEGEAVGVGSSFMPQCGSLALQLPDDVGEPAAIQEQWDGKILSKHHEIMRGIKSNNCKKPIT